jgi:hypothetical protein
VEALRPIAAGLVRALRRLGSLDPMDLALRLTLLDLLLRPVGPWWIRPILLALAACGLLVPDWCRKRWLWVAIAALTAARVVVDWPLADNHAYLLAYWCLAIALSRFVRDDATQLAWNARVLLGLAFGFATLWKLALSGSFLDGTFMRVTLLVDPRFEAWTQLVTGLDLQTIESSRAWLLRHAEAPQAARALALPDRFHAVALAMTAWTLAIEAAVAAAFLWPRGGLAARLRDGLLVTFCVTTYAVATVDGFGWLLTAMGVAQCASPRRRLAYVAGFLLILFYREVPWAELLLGGT